MFDLDASNWLLYGDNLALLPRIADSSVDLVYLDPPFNSKRDYNVIFGRHGTKIDNRSQVHAFEDTWHWSPEVEETYQDLLFKGRLPSQVCDVLGAMRVLLGENDAMAYMTNMAPRLVELHRTLKPSGSMVLHCDPTMSHYLKVLLDAIFGGRNFRNEIVWHYSGWNKKLAGHFERRHDTLLFYAKTAQQKFRSFSLPWESREQYVTVRKQKVHVGADGREYVLSDRGGGQRIERYLDEAIAYGRPVDDVWDIDKLNNSALEWLGYQTQKPVALLQRIVQACTDPGDIVLDPFCGCGSAIDAAIRSDRRWVGMDVAYVAVDLIEKRLRNTFGVSVRNSYQISGSPQDVDAANALFDRSHFEFEVWAVSLVNGTPKEKPGGDRGVDGVIRFMADRDGSIGKLLLSVKGGRDLKPAFVRDLLGTVSTQHAQMGSLITLRDPTRGMTEAINRAGSYTWPINSGIYPRIQVLTVKQLLGGQRLNAPALRIPAYAKAEPYVSRYQQLALL